MTFEYRFCRGAAHALLSAAFRFRARGAENVPADGGLILAMNHQSFFDPPLAAVSTAREMHFLARKSLMRWPLLGPLFPKLNVIPVDRDGSDMSALKSVIRVIRDGGAVLLFPEGTRTRDGNLQPARPGIGFVIAKTLAPVVPMRVFGSYEAYPRSAKFPRFHPVAVAIGKPLAFDSAEIEAKGKAIYPELGERVMQAIAALPDPR